jgi:hypothetical protein
VTSRCLNCDESTRRPAVVTTRVSHGLLLAPCQSVCSKTAILRRSLAAPPLLRQSSPRPPLQFAACFRPCALCRPARRQPGLRPTAPWRHRMSRNCCGISCSEHLPGQLAVVRAPPPPSGVGTAARHHRASPQGAELTARDVTFSGLRRRAPPPPPSGPWPPAGPSPRTYPHPHPLGD